ncbi:polysaccharide biosynthesis protein [Patescibacteria group bacterium]|nr:polysaccharide biosynthesis protein [Patescibacteria group bacterium]
MTISGASRKIFRRTPETRFAFFVVADILLIIVAVWAAFFLRFEGAIPPDQIPAMQRVLLLAILFTLPIFYISRLYSFSWSYVGTTELVTLTRAVTVSFVLVALVIFISKEYQFFSGFSRATLVMSYLFTFILTGGIRMAKRIYLESFAHKKITKSGGRTLIVGAGDSGEQILRSILQGPKGRYNPIGFVDDSSFKRKTIIHGIPVLGGIGDMRHIIEQKEITTMIIALPTENAADIRGAAQIGREAGLKDIKIIPPLAEVMAGGVSVNTLRDIQVEDLLGRKTVSLDENAIKDFIKGKIVCITGAAGSIGFELSHQIARFEPAKLILIDQDETGIFTVTKNLQKHFPELQQEAFIANIRDKEKMRDIFEERPHIVFHAAAYKHVALMEHNIDEALKNNVFGTEVVAQAARANGVEKFIFISTDKAVNPSSVYGMTKRIGEIICQLYNQKETTRFISVRFGNVLESRGSVIPIFKEQIERGGPVEITDPEMKRYFMMNSEACLLVMQAGALGGGGEVFILDMGEPVLIVDLAKEMIRLSGFEPDKDIPIVFTGIRPGEKLFEDILSAEEGTVATKYQKIFMAKLATIEEEEFQQYMERLRKSLQARENKELFDTLRAYFAKEVRS